MKALTDKLENSLADVFKAAPKIPENGRKALVNWMPWIALVFGVLQVWAAYALWRLYDRYDGALNYVNSVARSFGVETATPEVNIFFWLALVLLALSGVILLLAYPGLKARKKSGWNWLFYGELLSVVYAVVSLFFDGAYGGGVGRFIGALIGAAIGFYLLFQIRDHYAR